MIPPIFPAAGFLLFVQGIGMGRKEVSLLSHGKLGFGKLVSVEPAGAVIWSQTVHGYVFEFQDDNGKTHHATAETHRRHLLEDQEHEALLYDPEAPHHAVLVEALPGAPRIDQDGSVRMRSPVRGLACLIIPAATLLGHGYWFMHTMAMILNV